MSFEDERWSGLKPRMSFGDLVAGGCGGAAGLSQRAFWCEALAGSGLVDRGK